MGKAEGPNPTFQQCGICVSLAPCWKIGERIAGLSETEYIDRIIPRNPGNTRAVLMYTHRGVKAKLRISEHALRNLCES
jgi:hypothetical protein